MARVLMRWHPHGLYNGVPLTTSDVVPDGQVIALGTPVRQFILGTGWTEVQLAGWDARRIVQQGLADVLEWLGETPIPPRPDFLPPAAAGVMAYLKRTADYQARPIPGKPF
jgi:hypothetical protein